MSDIIDPMDDEILEPIELDDLIEPIDEPIGELIEPIAAVSPEPAKPVTAKPAVSNSDAPKPVPAAQTAAIAQPVGTTQPVATKPVAAAKPAAAKAVVVPEVAVSLPEGEEEDDDAPRQRRFLLLTAAPAWLVSTLVHAVIILATGLITFTEPMKIINVLTANPSTEEGEEVEEFTIQEIDPGDVSEVDEMVEPVEDLTSELEVVETAELEPMEVASMEVPMIDMASTMAPSMKKLQSLTSAVSSGAPMTSRSADMKKKMLREYGGTESSESAVTEALKWIALHQMPNGGWTFQHTLVCGNTCNHPGEEKFAKSVNGATACALLPFMGAGQTHVTGDYKKKVALGLRFLIQNGKAGTKNGLPMLDLRDDPGNFYSHGLATIALCEAYAMTGDRELLLPAQSAINFIVFGQCRDGGWRYTPGAAGGDTSVVGWQVMALKSGYMGHLTIPPATFAGSVAFLDKVGSDGGAIYGYDNKETNVRPTTTAVGLLCRMYSGWDREHPGIVKGVGHLSKIGVKKNNLYYNYYAAQVLRQNGGPVWDKFNVELRDWLVSTQDQSDGAKGSWYFEEAEPHSGPREGGRLLSTAFATMILEVYYRHMPLYADTAVEEDFPL